MVGAYCQDQIVCFRFFLFIIILVFFDFRGGPILGWLLFSERQLRPFLLRFCCLRPDQHFAAELTCAVAILDRELLV